MIGRLERRPLALVITLWIGFSLAVPGFLSTATFTSVLGRSVENGLIAVGFTVCLLAGKIDISVGALYALAGVVFATLEPAFGVPAALAGALGTGLAVGTLNGILIGRYRVNSFTATLGALLVCRGAAHVVSGGRPVSVSNLEASLWFNQTLIGPISPRVIVFVLVVIAVHLMLTRLRAGRELIATGGSPDAATAAGISVDGRVFLACAVSSLLASLAGAMSALSLLSGSPIVGDANLLVAVAGVFLGGAALTGGMGSVVATALAIVALASVAVGMELAGAPAAGQLVVTGVIVILASSGLMRRRAATLDGATAALRRATHRQKVEVKP